MSGYSEGGANHDNVLKSWQPRHYSAVEDYDRNLETLRSRSYDLYCNNPVGAAAINTQVQGVLGSGLKLYPRLDFEALGLTPEYARQWTRQVKSEFELWAGSLMGDFYRRNNFYELQRIAFLNYLADGDCFCLFRRRVPTARMPYSLQLQLIEAARVSNPLGKGGVARQVEMQLPGSEHRIINGIEIDAAGRLEAIWISNRIWNEPQAQVLKWRRVRYFGKESGARNVLQICFDTRTEQYRGVPYLAPVIRELKQLTRYSDAELTSAIIKSYFGLFFVQPSTNFDFNDILPEDKDEPVVDPREYKLASGTISALPRGVDVKAIDKSNAQSTFSSFIGAYLEQIGAALGLPHEVLTKHFTASYSASRAALLLAEESFKQRRAAFVADFCQPVYEAFMTEAVATGRIKAEGYFEDALKRQNWLQASWRGTVMPNIDPLKEANAAAKRIEIGISTREIESSAIGTDFNENAAELATEKVMTDEDTFIWRGGRRFSRGRDS